MEELQNQNNREPWRPLVLLPVGAVLLSNHAARAAGCAGGPGPDPVAGLPPASAVGTGGLAPTAATVPHLSGHRLLTLPATGGQGAQSCTGTREAGSCLKQKPPKPWGYKPQSYLCIL